MEMDDVVEKVICFGEEVKHVKERVDVHDEAFLRIENKIDKILWWVMGIMGSVILSIILK